MPTPKRRQKKRGPRAPVGASKAPVPATPPRIQPGYSGFLVVRLHQAAPLIDRLEAIPAIADLLQSYGVKLSSPVIRSYTLAELRQRERGWKIPLEKSLAAYWRLDTRHLEPSRAESLIKDLKRLDVVNVAYVDPPASPPVSPSNDPLVKKQRYLNKAPTGIDARSAWKQAGGSGQGVRIVDLEAGWHTHVDLPAVQLLPGVSVEVRGSIDCKHGTAVLGILVALDNGKGGVGIAPDATISVASYFRSDPMGAASPVDPNACSQPGDFTVLGHVADTITQLLPHLKPGDVLLLEVQKFNAASGLDNMPTELDDLDFTAIEAATNLGIVVVECAGNNASDLDALPVLDRDHPQFKDSGAIMVAGCEAKVSTKVVGAKKVKGHKRFLTERTLPDGTKIVVGSNFGSRIDCHAWGEKVATTGLSPTLGSIYVENFEGTSAAGPIVAGAAAVVQAARKAAGLAFLTPAQMRDVLRQTGTPQFPGPKKIGTMPNLKQAIPAALALP